MASPPPHLYSQETAAAGTGLFASEAIPPGVEILQIERPLVYVLDSPHLKDTCSECSLSLPEKSRDHAPHSKSLKACHGCKITRYCCKVGYRCSDVETMLEKPCIPKQCQWFIEMLSVVSLVSCMKLLGAKSIECSVAFACEPCGRISRPRYYFYSPTKPISCRNARFGHGRTATNTNARSMPGSIQTFFQTPSVW